MATPYSFHDIRRMRADVRRLLTPHYSGPEFEGFMVSEVDEAQVEAQLQTYLIAGIPPEAIKDAADAYWDNPRGVTATK